MTNEQVKRLCKEKELELLNKYFCRLTCGRLQSKNFVKETAFGCPETI